VKQQNDNSEPKKSSTRAGSWPLFGSLPMPQIDAAQSPGRQKIASHIQAANHTKSHPGHRTQKRGQIVSLTRPDCTTRTPRLAAR